MAPLGTDDEAAGTPPSCASSTDQQFQARRSHTVLSRLHHRACAGVHRVRLARLATMTDRKAPTRSDLGWAYAEPNIRWKPGNISTSVAGGTPGAGDGELMLGCCSPGNESPIDVRV